MACKRKIDQSNVLLIQSVDSLLNSKSTVLLLDIEGTTTSINFVKEELFPYILKNVERFLTTHWKDEETQADVGALRDQAKADKDLKGFGPILPPESNVESIIESVVANVKWQMSADRKTTALKQLQGHMWRDAYKEQEVKGHLYDEVESAFKSWKQAGHSICIYSSGSVAAQKLLFSHSICGDLTEYISDYFDAKVGAKREAKSYKNICEFLKVSPGDVLFLTDIFEEAEAADKAGVTPIIIRRPGNAPLTDDQLAQFTTMNDFHNLVTAPDSDGVKSKHRKQAETA